MMDRTAVVTSVVAAAVLLTGGGVSRAARGADTPPPNAAAKVKWSAEEGALRVSYHGGVILDGAVVAEDGAGKPIDVAARLAPTVKRHDNGKVEQRLRFTPATPRDGVRLVLRATVTASDEALAAETNGDAQRRFPLVRTSVGRSRNLRNNAVYDRRWDWALIGPTDGTTRIVPRADKGDERSFDLEIAGRALELVFQPRYYQAEHGLRYYEPWTYRIWQGSVTGYCTWWAYKYDFTQETLDQLVDIFVDKRLPDFGYHYIQLDDTYQIGNGSCPQNWLTWNDKFPGGPAYALQRIKDAGMMGGIWVHRIHRPSDPHVKQIGEEHPDWFVKKADGSLFQGHGFYVLNTKNPAAIDGMVRPIYRELKKQGWDYVKIDGAGDLLNAYKNKECADHFKRIASTPEESLRDWDRVARTELGPDIYILNCWGTDRGRVVVGLVDGCRLSDDGFQPETLANNSAMEGVVWRGDPDHCDILGTWLTDPNAMMPVFGLEQPAPVRTIVRPAICSVAGGVLMLSDKVETYTDDVNIEGMKRSAPVLTTVPGQLYNVGQGSATWWLQEIERPFDRWAVLTRMQWPKKRDKEWTFDLKGLPAREVKFADIGLEPDREYAVFEFWTQTYLGAHRDAFTAPPMDTNDGMDVFAIREVREHPWVLATTRHLSQGGVSLSDVRWDAGARSLSGNSAVIQNDPYVLTIHVPRGYRVRNAEAGGRKVEVTAQQSTVALRVAPTATETVEWVVRFGK